MSEWNSVIPKGVNFVTTESVALMKRLYSDEAQLHKMSSFVIEHSDRRKVLDASLR